MNRQPFELLPALDGALGPLQIGSDVLPAIEPILRSRNHPSGFPHGRTTFYDIVAMTGNYGCLERTARRILASRKSWSEGMLCTAAAECLEFLVRPEPR